MRRLLITLLVGGAVACALPDDPPHEPDPLPEGPATAATPPPAQAPAPAGSPVLGSPSTSPTPAPEEEGEDGGGEAPPAPGQPTTPPQGGGCGDPVPPPLTRIKVTIHLRGTGHWTLDATPLVGPDPDYCAAIGFTDGRANCPLRPEGHPEREACEAWAVGRAVDTGRAGPTWRRNGGLCTGAASGCENHPENQYLLKAFLGGSYEACARSGVCGDLLVDR